MIHIEDRYGRAPDRCSAAQPDTLPLEMLRPHISARMKQARELAADRIEPGDVWTFAQIAGKAGPGKIRRVRLSGVLFRDDVIAMKRQLAGGFREAAVFAASRRAADDGLLQRPVGSSHACYPAAVVCRERRARDFINSSSRPTCR